MKRLPWTMLLLAAVCTGCAWAEDAKDAVDARALFSALRNDNMAFLERNLERIPDLNVRDQAGNSLIHALIAPGQVLPPDPPPIPGRVRYIERDGERIAVQEVVLPPPMAVSVRPVKMSRQRSAVGPAYDPLQARMALIRKLAARGVPINGVNNNGQTPLHVAARNDSMIPQILTLVDGWASGAPDPAQHRRFVEFLIGLGADPALADRDGRTPAFLTANKLLLPLLVRGAALEARDKDGLTLFLHAPPEQALALLQLGADPHAVDSRGRNRWFYLFGSGWQELAGRLLELGVNSALPDRDGRSVLAAYCDKEYLPQARFLVGHGADPAWAGRDGRAPLHLAAMKQNQELLALLLQNGAPVNERGKSGETPISLACRNRGCVELLLGHGADPSIPDRSGRNVLHMLAAWKDERSLEMLAFFIERKMPLDQRDARGRTPLAVAFEESNLKAMERLLESGADPDSASSAGWTLFDRAEAGDKTSAVELLRRHGARHGRSWASRHRVSLYYALLLMGIVPLAVLVFGLMKPALFKKSLLRIMPAIGMALGLSFAAVAALGSISGESDYMPLFMLLALPLLAALLVLFAAVRTLADRVAPVPGIILSLLTTAGSPGVIYGMLWPISWGFKGEGGMALGYMFYMGSVAAAVSTLVYALVVWIRKALGVRREA